jgi:hypothetical protein
LELQVLLALLRGPLLHNRKGHPMIKISKESKAGKFGTADFAVDELGHEIKREAHVPNHQTKMATPS